ncbi:hypothetical protein AC579_8827 [Pseudocercospora musae]|uniref:Uncharacterized protein n=1 Tax=Pseudocercospora musae TaxID=113226 RepID=A0A139GTB0_9PEZI|nr:hypothetical protein AC579_8827 [Pseudocercospora musae]
MANLKFLLCMIFFATLGLASVDDISSRIHALNKGPGDMMFLGDDGVFRVFNSFGRVHKYIQFTNEELSILESGKPENEKKFMNTDGRDVEHEHCMNPHQHILPEFFRAQNIKRGALGKRIQLCSKAFCDFENPCTGTKLENQYCPCTAQTYGTCGT